MDISLLHAYSKRHALVPTRPVTITSLLSVPALCLYQMYQTYLVVVCNAHHCLPHFSLNNLTFQSCYMACGVWLIMLQLLLLLCQGDVAAQ